MSEHDQDRKKGRSMDVKEIKKLIDLMVKNDLRELEIRDGEQGISLKRGGGDVPAVNFAQSPVAANGAAGQTSGNPKNAVQTKEESGESELESIVSPMVGTFYHSANPESSAYVQVGEKVTAETVVCIVEAMKVMNEIKAGVNGIIEKVMVANGEAVEFGQQMFLVRPTE